MHEPDDNGKAGGSGSGSGGFGRNFGLGKSLTHDLYTLIVLPGHYHP